MTKLYIRQDTINFQYPANKKSETNVIVEAPVDISVNSKYWLTLMCTPTNLEELASGFIYNEGVINSIDEIKLIDVCENKTSIDIWLNHSVDFPEKWQRTSGCTGGTTSVSLKKLPQAIVPQFQVSSRVITDLVNELLSNQDLYSISGGVHSSAVSEGDNLLVVMEDIGRHNTLDKIAGWLLSNKGKFKPSIVRQQGESVQKCCKNQTELGLLS